jgi:hypothetical protein
LGLVWKALVQHFSAEEDLDKIHFVRRGQRSSTKGRMLSMAKYNHSPSLSVSHQRASAFAEQRFRPSWLASWESSGGRPGVECSRPGSLEAGGMGPGMSELLDAISQDWRYRAS